MTAGESLLVSQVRKLWLREGTSVAGQWWGLCASTAGGEGLIPGRGTTIPQTTPGTEAFWLQSPSCWHHINAPQQRKLVFPTVWPGVSLCPFSSEIFTVLPVTDPVVLPSPGFSCYFCFLTLFSFLARSQRLAGSPEVEPSLQQWGYGVLITGLPGNSFSLLF